MTMLVAGSDGGRLPPGASWLAYENGWTSRGGKSTVWPVNDERPHADGRLVRFVEDDACGCLRNVGEPLVCW